MPSPWKCGRSLISVFGIDSSWIYSDFGLVYSYCHPEIVSLGKELKYHFEGFELECLYCFLGLAGIIHFRPIGFLFFSLLFLVSRLVKVLFMFSSFYLKLYIIFMGFCVIG